MSSSNDASTTIGWDLGGVHVKAARIVGGRAVEAVQAPCRLWRGLGALDETFAGLPDWTRRSATHAVTMTGELTDCFEDRRAGVGALSGWAAAHLSGDVRIYAGRSGFVASERAADLSADVASANWHATAALAGRHVGNGLLCDIGSTTTDLIPLVDGQPRARGYSDSERLESGELIYSGVVRTPVLALATWAPWQGRRQGLMAETFANTADLYRLTGDLPDGADQQSSPDLKGKSIGESETRLARMIGRDLGEGTSEAWRALAAHFAEAQLRAIADAAATLLSRVDLDPQAPLVLCGAGGFLGARVARRLGRPSVELTDLLGATSAPDAARWISTCGPAVAVGLLAAGAPGLEA